MSCFHTVHIYFFEEADTDLAHFLKAKIEEIIPLRVVPVLAPLPLPKTGYHPERGQFEARPFLKTLWDLKKEPDEIPLGITSEDLFEDGLNFIFGVALPEYVALVATARLHESFYGHPENRALYYERVLKECMHELGHVFGLEHCPDPKCVMHFSNTLADTDYKSYHYCERCQTYVESAVCGKY